MPPDERALHVLKLQRSEDAQAPEFRYLLSLVRVEVERTWSRVAFQVGDETGAGLSRPDASADVLVLGASNVLLRGPSLERMRRELLAGADVVLPLPLASLPLPAERPPYTLRDFDQLERSWLDVPPEAARPSSHLPVSLWSGVAFARLLERHGLAEICTCPDLLAEEGGRTELRHAGLYHSFADYYGEVRDDILPHLPEGARDVLEIGCGRGATGAFLKRELGCRVTGIELNPDVAREAAAVLDRVVAGNVLDVELSDRFDAVVALELFEHLAEPERFLARARDWLRPRGRILLSVPNVGHYSVVEDLLAGRWDYLPIGLLCYTHYRFFTRRTLADWIRRCGFRHFQLVAQRTELPDELRNLPAPFETDEESLATKGFYVLIDV